MRVLYVITKAEHGGAQTHVLDLLRGLSAIEKCLVAGEDGPLVAQARKLSIPCTVLPSLVHRISPGCDLGAIRELRRLIRRVRPDIVHCHSSKAGFVGRLAARLEGVPTVFTAHGWGFSEGIPWPRRVVALWAERLAARWTNALIVVSQFDRDLALRFGVGAPSRIRVVYNGVPDVPQRAKPSEGGPVVATMVARFTPQKDHLTLLQAARLVDGDWRLVLVGDGPTRPAVERFVERNRLAHRVSFLGLRDDVPDILARSHVFCLVSNWEGLPISVIEAMRAGLPVVATDVGGVRELVVHGRTGLLCRRQDPEHVAECLSSVLDSAYRRALLGANGRARYEESFSVEPQLAAVEAVYRECTKNRLSTTGS
jgi:glycosyltransferase involved in cell wall biosynthesis